MKNTEGAKAGISTSALATSLLVAIMLPLDPDHILRERRISVPNAVAASEKQKIVPESTTPIARDPKIAVEEEYQMARQRGTVEALELFIARHPDSPLAAKARLDLQRLPR